MHKIEKDPLRVRRPLFQKPGLSAGAWRCALWFGLPATVLWSAVIYFFVRGCSK